MPGDVSTITRIYSPFRLARSSMSRETPPMSRKKLTPAENTTTIANKANTPTTIASTTSEAVINTCYKPPDAIQANVYRGLTTKTQGG